MHLFPSLVICAVPHTYRLSDVQLFRLAKYLTAFPIDFCAL